MTLVDFCNLLINGTIEGLLIALPALALTLVMGVSRFPNAATGDYMTVSAYAASACRRWAGLDPPGAWGGCAGAALSVIFYLCVFTLRARRWPAWSGHRRRFLFARCYASSATTSRRSISRCGRELGVRCC
jgi:branched-subunit amino acid ABC-type transport system permease component